MVKEITSADEFNKEIKVPNLVVVDFYATWCGPCKMIAPFIEQLQSKYPEVKFIKVAEHNCQDLIMTLGVRAFPTFHFYVNGNKVDELQGADARSLENKVIQYKVNVGFAGSGQKLGATPVWDGVGLPPGNARDARLKAFGSIDSKAPSNPSKSEPHSISRTTPSDAVAMDVDEDDDEEALAMAIALSKANKNKEAESKSSTKDLSADAQDKQDQAEAEAAFAATEGGHDGWDEEMVPVPVDENILKELVEMGFPDVRARKGIVHGKDLEGALGWLTEHLEDPDIDQPYMVRKRDTIPKIPLTEEQKKEQIAALKLKFKQRREDKSKQEKAEELKKEKDRRERGQKMDNIAEERERAQRKREAEKIKREKDDAKREKERLLAEIAHDKAIRAKNKGVLPSVLGVDGYNPSIIQYDKPAAGAGTSSAASSESTAAAKAVSSKSSSVKEEKQAVSNTKVVTIEAAERTVDSSISTIMRYRTAGDGGQALKLLHTFVKNVADAPEERKFWSINMESKAFKSKFANILGPLPLLKALGFGKVEAEGGEAKLQLDSVNLALFQSTVNKLAQAEQTYAKMNS